MPDIDLLDRIWFGNSLSQWLVAAATLGAAYVVLSLLRQFSVRRLGVLLQAGRWGSGLIGFTVEHYSRKRGDSDVGTRRSLRRAAIVLDKPFVVGDAIQVDNINGTIEHVGLKTTRIRSLSGEQIVTSNADLLRSRIRNYKRMEQRRAVFTLDLAFDTPAEKVAAIPTMVRGIVEAQPLTRFDRSHLLTIEPTGLRVENGVRRSRRGLQHVRRHSTGNQSRGTASAPTRADRVRIRHTAGQHATFNQ